MQFQIIIDESTIGLPLEDVIDIGAECERLKREIDKVSKHIKSIDAKLSNKKFVANAPEEVVEEQRERRTDALATQEKLKSALKRLEAAI